MEDMSWADGIIIGSPSYFGLPAHEIIALIDKSVEIRGDPLSTGGYYGAASNAAPDEQARSECQELGRRVALLAEKIRG